MVMDWSAQLIGLDSSFLNSSEVGGGVMQVNPTSASLGHLYQFSQTSASDSALTAVVAARSRYLAQHPGVQMESLVLYTTTQTHSLGKKAGLVLGLATRALEVTSETNFGLRGSALQQALAEDIGAGKNPFMLSKYHLSRT